jgi:hypothetical protein
MGLVAVCQFEGSVLDFCYFALGQQAKTVDESQIGHETHHIEGLGVRTVRCPLTTVNYELTTV